MNYCSLISYIYSECLSGGGEPALWWGQNKNCQPVQQSTSIHWRRRRGNAAGRHTRRGRSRGDQRGSGGPEDTGDGAERKGDEEREWCKREQGERSAGLWEREAPARQGSHGESSKRAGQKGREEEGTSQGGQKGHKRCQIICQVSGLERRKAEQPQHWHHEGEIRNPFISSSLFSSPVNWIVAVLCRVITATNLFVVCPPDGYWGGVWPILI